MLADRSLIGFVAVTDLERARRFYCAALGLELLADEGFALVLRSGSQALRVVEVEGMTPRPFTVLGWDIPGLELDATVAGLAETGVEFLRYEHFEQDEQGVWTAPNGDRVAWFRDPDDNVLSLTARAQ